jgi:hypothetical protein
LKPKGDHDWYCVACRRRKWDVNPPVTPRHIIAIQESPGSQSLPVGDQPSGAAPSRRHSGQSQKGDNLSEGSRLLRGSHKKEESHQTSANESPTSGECSKSNALEPQITEGCNLGKPGSDTAETDKSIGKPRGESTSDHTARSMDAQTEMHYQAIRRMQVEIETLREELRKKEEEPRELDDLRMENAMLKRRIESLETSSTEQRDIDSSSIESS